MKKLYFLMVSLMLLAAGVGRAQDNIVETEPSPLQEGSEDVTIIFHADRGNQGLKGVTGTNPVYAHTGVITNKSDGNWAYAPSKWGDNDPKYQLQYDGPNTWTLYIGNIREYYGITDPTEVVEKLCFVFRTADCSKEGKTATGGDIFVDVLPDGFQLEFVSDAGIVLNSQNATVNFTARTTSAAKIELFLGDTSGTPFASLASGMELKKSYTFSAGAETQVIARATQGANVETKTISICYPGNSPQKAYPGGGTPKMGAVAQANGDVIFCIAAPNKTNAMIIPSWSGYKATKSNMMNYTDVDGIRYFWISVSGIDATKDYPYYYLIDETYQVGDPYAHYVLDPYSDKWLSDGVCPGMIPYPKEEVDGSPMLAVYRGNRDTQYKWQVQNFVGPKPEDLIVYELLIRDFTGTEGKADGNGTLALAMQKLDYLKKLGVNAVELMPIMEFNGNNSWGYNTNFYFATDKAYGSPDQYRQFIDECHKRGMAVILDIVFNQSDGLHPWYQLYPAGNNPFYNERAPHAYSVLNDWNQDNMLVQQQWRDCVRYWMEAYKVDGFRFDLVKGLGDNASYGGNANDYNTNKYNASRVARMKELTALIHSINPNAYSINENLAGAQEENQMANNGSLNWANINEASCQFAMGFQSDSNCNRFYAPQDGPRNWGSTISYAESHDEQRMAYKQNTWGAAGVKGNLAASMVRLGSVAAQMLLCPGGHMIWQFGELGDGTNTKNADGGNNTDPKPVYWDYLNVPDRLGLFNTYRDLIGLRTLNTDLFAQSASFSNSCNVSNWANGRFIYASTSSKELICVINPELTQKTFQGVTFKQKSNSAYRVGAASYNCNYSFDAASGSVTLAPGAFLCLISNNVVGADLVDADALVPYTVSGGFGEIVISGDYNNAQVYSIYGQQYGSLNVPAGLYVVVVDGQAYKVLVK